MISQERMSLSSQIHQAFVGPSARSPTYACHEAFAIRKVCPLFFFSSPRIDMCVLDFLKKGPRHTFFSRVERGGANVPIRGSNFF